MDKDNIITHDIGYVIIPKNKTEARSLMLGLPTYGFFAAVGAAFLISIAAIAIGMPAVIIIGVLIPAIYYLGWSLDLSPNLNLAQRYAIRRDYRAAKRAYYLDRTGGQ